MDSEKDEKTGEDIPAMTLGEVTVTAKSKTVPERNGIISIPFKEKEYEDWKQEIDGLRSSWVLDTIISSNQSLSYYYKLIDISL